MRCDIFSWLVEKGYTFPFACRDVAVKMSSLGRAQSWPLLAGNAAAAAAAAAVGGGGDASKGGGGAGGARVTQLQARRLLCRHYYLEGGWGWVVATCSVLVHVLAHGLQLSCSQLVAPATRKFQVAAVHPAGEQCRYFCTVRYDGDAKSTQR